MSQVLSSRRMEGMWPWRIFLIPLLDRRRTSNKEDVVIGGCVLVSQCHWRLRSSLDSLVQQSLMDSNGSSVLPILAALHGPSRRSSILTDGRALLAWTRSLSRGLLDRICLAAGATCRQLILAAFCQSAHHFCQQAGDDPASFLSILSKLCTPLKWPSSSKS